MVKQDQNHGDKRRQACAPDPMLRKTVVPVIITALCVLLLIAVSACNGAHESASDAL